MNKLNFFGIGPKMATVLLPWLAASITISCIYKDYFVFTPSHNNAIMITGILLMGGGLIFYGSTVRILLKGLKNTKLMTTGTYGLCQNPLYSSIVLFIIPALSLILNSWLVLTSSVIGYILFRIFIKNEYKELEKFFGEEYLGYRDRTPEFFPIPLKRWLLQIQKTNK